jgi:hypothetical protein
MLAMVEMTRWCENAVSGEMWLKKSGTKSYWFSLAPATATCMTH